MMVVIFHRLMYTWTGAEDFFTDETAFLDMPWFTAIMFFAGMGGIFSTISGIVTSYSTYNRINIAQTKKKAILVGALISFLWLTIVGYTRKFLFGSKAYFEGDFYYGFVTGSLRLKEFYVPQLELFYYTSTLMIIGLSGFVVPVLMILLFRNGGIEKIRRNKTILGVLAAIILVLTPILSILLEPIGTDAFLNGNYFTGFLIALLVNPYFPIFPILAYAILGGILGISLARGEKKRNITITWSLVGFVFLSIGNTLLISALRRGFYNFNFVRFMQLGTYFMIIILLLNLIDFKPKEKQEKIVKNFAPVMRFGRTSLTIFVLEAFVAAIFHFIYDLIVPGWNDELIMVLLFGVFNLALWWVILLFWEKKEFKGSIEWLGGQIIRKLSGTTSKKTQD